MGEVGWGGMIDFGGAAFGFEASVGFEPGWQDGRFLGPTNDGGFVAPMEKFAHRAAVNAGDHKSLHGGFRGPKSGGPESRTAIAEQVDGENAIGAGGLARRAKGVNQEHGKKAPGTNAEASDRDKGHAARMSNWDGGVKGSWMGD